MKGSIEVHVIPKISFGISAFSDKTSHAVFFRMDGKGELTLTLGAASATLSNKEKLTKEAFVGCAKLTGELKAELGAETKFFNLWDKSTKATVWKKEYEIWEVILHFDFQIKRWHLMVGTIRRLAIRRRRSVRPRTLNTVRL